MVKLSNTKQESEKKKQQKSNAEVLGFKIITYNWSRIFKRSRNILSTIVWLH